MYTPFFQNIGHAKMFLVQYNAKVINLRGKNLQGRVHTESTRHESTRMLHETNRLNLRGNMDTPMRE